MVESSHFILVDAGLILEVKLVLGFEGRYSPRAPFPCGKETQIREPFESVSAPRCASGLQTAGLCSPEIALGLAILQPLLALIGKALWRCDTPAVPCVLSRVS